MDKIFKLLKEEIMPFALKTIFIKDRFPANILIKTHAHVKYFLNW